MKKQKLKELKKKSFIKIILIFLLLKKKNCDKGKKEISVTSTEGIYKRGTNQSYSWIIFTSASWKTNTID